MAGGGRSILKVIVENFLASLSPKRLTNKPRLVGKDDYGNKYYELCSDDSSGKQTIKRWYETEVPDDWEKEVPVEWEAWLRRRRFDPPTQEEIEENYRKMLSVKSKAAELDGKQISRIQVDTTGSKEETKTEFPRHEEYEVFPGEKYFPEDKRK